MIVAPVRYLPLRFQVPRKNPPGSGSIQALRRSVTNPVTLAMEASVQRNGERVPIRAMALFHDTNADAVAKLLGHENPGVVISAAEALGRMGVGLVYGGGSLSFDPTLRVEIVSERGHPLYPSRLNGLPLVEIEWLLYQLDVESMRMNLRRPDPAP